MERRRPRTPGAPGPGIVYPAWARSSVAERGTFNPCVVGSNPTGLTNVANRLQCRLRAHDRFAGLGGIAGHVFSEQRIDPASAPIHHEAL